jgi:hypothetical protein
VWFSVSSSAAVAFPAFSGRFPVWGVFLGRLAAEVRRMFAAYGSRSATGSPFLV